MHGAVAILASVPLLVQGVTGALLTYEGELRNALGEGVMSGERAEMREVLAALEEQLAGSPRWMIYFEAEGEPVWIRWAGEDGKERSYLADPGTGEILEDSTRWHRRFETVLGIHRRLGLGKAGQAIMGTSSLLLAGLLLSGLVLQIKRSRDLWRVLGLRRQERRLWIWLHGSLGTWMTPLLLILALTGPVWSFAGYRALISWFTQTEVTTYGAAPVKVQADAQTDLDSILKGAAAYDPGGGAKRLMLPSGPGAPARFEWAPPDAPWENFRSRAWLHPQNGEVLRLDAMESYTPADKVIRWAYPIHIGKWGGEPTRILHFLAALSVPFFVCTGGWLYWKRKYN